MLRYDEVHDVAVMPLKEGISKVYWATLEDSSHNGHSKEVERYSDILGQLPGNEDWVLDVLGIPSHSIRFFGWVI